MCRKGRAITRQQNKDRSRTTEILTVTNLQNRKTYEANSASFVQDSQSRKNNFASKETKEADNIIKARHDRQRQLLLVVRNCTDTLKSIEECIQNKIGRVNVEVGTTKRPVVLHLTGIKVRQLKKTYA